MRLHRETTLPGLCPGQIAEAILTSFLIRSRALRDAICTSNCLSNLVLEIMEIDIISAITAIVNPNSTVLITNSVNVIPLAVLCRLEDLLLVMGLRLVILISVKENNRSR